jgi:hypothetical protein
MHISFESPVCLHRQLSTSNHTYHRMKIACKSALTVCYANTSRFARHQLYYSVLWGSRDKKNFQQLWIAQNTHTQHAKTIIFRTWPAPSISNSRIRAFNCVGGRSGSKNFVTFVLRDRSIEFKSWKQTTSLGHSGLPW